MSFEEISLRQDKVVAVDLGYNLYSLVWFVPRQDKCSPSLGLAWLREYRSSVVLLSKFLLNKDLIEIHTQGRLSDFFTDLSCEGTKTTYSVLPPIKTLASL